MQLERLYRDLAVILLSIVATLALIHFGLYETLRTSLSEQVVLGSFIAGAFFTSFFTLAPAAVALSELMQLSSPLTVAFWGGLGAMFGDALLFLFIRDVFAEDLKRFFKAHVRMGALTQFHFGFLKWLYPIIGAMIIASPLPDELGLALLGLTKTHLAILLPIAFVMNFLGILALGGIVTSF